MRYVGLGPGNPASFTSAEALAVLRQATEPLTSRELLTRLRRSVNLAPYAGSPHRDLRWALDTLAGTGCVVKARWEGWAVYAGECPGTNPYACLVSPKDQRAAVWMTRELAQELLARVQGWTQRFDAAQALARQVEQALPGAEVAVVLDRASGAVTFTLSVVGDDEALGRLARLVQADVRQ